MIYCYRLEKSSLVDAEHAPISEKRFHDLLLFINRYSIQITFNAKRRSYYILIDKYKTKQDFSEFLDKHNNTVFEESERTYSYKKIYQLEQII